MTPIDRIIDTDAKPVPSTPLGLEVTAERASLAQRSIISASQPVVKAEHRTIDVPESMVTSGLWGEPREIIRYLRDVNGVPDGAKVDVIEFPSSANVTRITFTWWEIDALIPRGQFGERGL